MEEERISPEWLVEQGCREPHGRDPAQPATYAFGAGYGVLVQTVHGDWNWCRNNHVIATIKTKDQFLALKKGLGISIGPVDESEDVKFEWTARDRRVREAMEKYVASADGTN